MKVPYKGPFGDFVASVLKGVSSMKTWKATLFKNKPWATLNQKSVVRPRNMEVRKYEHHEVVPVRVVKKGHCCQAERVMAKFGGAQRLVEAMKRIGCDYNVASLYKWTYPRPKGRGGIIPGSAWADVLAAARNEGISLSPEDKDPNQFVKEPRKPYEKRDFT